MPSPGHLPSGIASANLQLHHESSRWCVLAAGWKISPSFCEFPYKMSFCGVQIIVRNGNGDKEIKDGHLPEAIDFQIHVFSAKEIENFNICFAHFPVPQDVRSEMLYRG